MLELSERIESTAVQFLSELRRQGSAVKVNSVAVDEYGQAHVKGGMFGATGKRDVHLSLSGLEAHDVAEFRKELKAKTGLTLSQAEADSLLMDARNALANGMLRDVTEDKRAYEREKKAKRRQWARANGLCVICVKNPVTDRADGRTSSTCKDCQSKANAAKKRKPDA